MRTFDFIKRFTTRHAIYSIFALSLFIRLYQLALIPHGFHVDEVISGYIGRFVLLNGKDVYGNILPVFYFDSFGDFRTILPMYLNGLSTFVFGVNVFAVRFPTALIGSLTVFPVFWIGRMIFKNEKFALVPPLILTILPWHIVLSRATDEAVVGLTLVAFALYFLLKSVFEKKVRLLVFGSLCLFGTYFMYPSFRFIAPFLVLPFPLLTRAHRKWYILTIFFFITVSILFFLTPYGRGRLEQTSLLGNRELADRITAENIALSYDEGNNNNSAFVARIFHNKFISYSQELETQYASYFSPNFLFLRGGLPDRYVVPYTGLLFVTFGIFLSALFLPTVIAINTKIYMYLLYLLLISPLPAIITIEDVPNVNRDIMMSLIFVFLIGIGFAKALSVLKNKNYKIIFVSVVIFTTLLEFIYFEHQYFAISPSYKSFLRNDGNQELITYLKTQTNKDNIIVPIHDMPMYYLFFNNNFDKSIVGKFQKNLLVKQIKNLSFSTEFCTTNGLTQTQRNLKNELIVEDGNCQLNASYIVVHTILRRDSTVAFRVLAPK